MHPQQPDSQNIVTRSRLDSVDLLRGLVMVLMVVDHVRYPYFTNIQIPPENVSTSYLALFLTRWITHFCAPLFFFLAGSGAYLMITRGKSVNEVSKFLLTRGLWLVFLELAVIGFLWSFMPGWGFAGVIWSLGWSMVILSFVIRFPLPAVAIFGIGIMTQHHLFEGISGSSFGIFEWLWKFLYAGGQFEAEWLPAKFFPVLYTIIPGCGVMAAGFALGSILTKHEQERRKWLLILGLTVTMLFIILRATNWYGSPPTPEFPENVPAQYRFSNDFVPQETVEKSVMSFLKTQKYPFSFQFLLMTIGPGLLLLGWFDRFTFSSLIGKWIGKKILVFGRVPMFFYLVHLFLIHLLAIVYSLVSQLPVDWLFGNPVPYYRSSPPGYGFGLEGTYFITLIVVVTLYVPCRWFAELKRRRKDWWLGYL